MIVPLPEGEPNSWMSCPAALKVTLPLRMSGTQMVSLFPLAPPLAVETVAPSIRVSVREPLLFKLNTVALVFAKVRLLRVTVSAVPPMLSVLLTPVVPANVRS